jgi:SAM-dependent methyltransferase
MAKLIHANTFSINESNFGATSRLFWESKAFEYPLPFEEKLLSRTLPVINLISEKGILIEGAKVLEIGCGTGAFALPLAQQKASVTALDISDNMLNILAGEAKRLHLDSVRPIRYSWKEIDVRETCMEGAFDIALSSFSSAIEAEEDILKMERCSTQWCLYIASGKVRRTTLCEKILRAFDAPLNPNPDIRNIKRILIKMKRPFFFQSFTEKISGERSFKQIAEQVATRLEAAGRKPDPDFIFKTISSMCIAYTKENKIIECHGSVDIGVLIWRVDGKQV